MVSVVLAVGVDAVDVAVVSVVLTVGVDAVDVAVVVVATTVTGVAAVMTCKLVVAGGLTLVVQVKAGRVYLRALARDTVLSMVSRWSPWGGPRCTQTSLRRVITGSADRHQSQREQPIAEAARLIYPLASPLIKADIVISRSARSLRNVRAVHQRATTAFAHRRGGVITVCDVSRGLLYL